MLSGLIKVLIEQAAIPDIEALIFKERLGLLIDREMIQCVDIRWKTRLHQTNIIQNACVQKVNYRHPRGLDKELVLDFIQC